MKQLTQYDLDRLKKSAKNANRILKEFADLTNYRFIDNETQQVVVKKGTRLIPYKYKDYEKIVQDLNKEYLKEITVQMYILNGGDRAWNGAL